MPTTIYKRPKRKKKYYKGKAIIFKEQHERQNAYSKRKSAIYQDAIFNRYGSELSLINTFQALSITIIEFNNLYQDTLHPKHGILCLLIKHYTTATGNNIFKPNDLYNYYPYLNNLLGYWSKNARKFKVLFNDLMHFHFINPNGHAYISSMRLRTFCKLYENHCKKLFKIAIQ
jgi:hypothetical protein